MSRRIKSGTLFRRFTSTIKLFRARQALWSGRTTILLRACCRVMATKAFPFPILTLLTALLTSGELGLTVSLRSRTLSLVSSLPSFRWLLARVRKLIVAGRATRRVTCRVSTSVGSIIRLVLVRCSPPLAEGTLFWVKTTS